jgi:hypothetical protein
MIAFLRFQEHLARRVTLCHDESDVSLWNSPLEHPISNYVYNDCDGAAGAAAPGLNSDKEVYYQKKLCPILCPPQVRDHRKQKRAEIAPM